MARNHPACCRFYTRLVLSSLLLQAMFSIKRADAMSVATLIIPAPAPAPLSSSPWVASSAPPPLASSEGERSSGTMARGSAVQARPRLESAQFQSFKVSTFLPNEDKLSLST